MAPVVSLCIPKHVQLLKSILSSLLLPACLEAIAAHFLLLITPYHKLGVSYKERRFILTHGSGSRGKALQLVVRVFLLRVPGQYRAWMVRDLDKLFYSRPTLNVIY